MFGPIVFFTLPEDPQTHMLKNSSSEASYRRLSDIARERGIDLRFILGEGAFQNGTFTNFWIFNNDTLTNVKEAFKPVFLHKKHMTPLLEEFPRVNNAYLEKVSIDKILTAQTFPDFIKKTFSIDENSLSVVNEIKTDLIVVKPRYGSEGRNVKVLPKNEITKDTINDEEYIAQEFIESSGGIPGLISQRHEMRLYVFNGIIQSAYLRLPTEDSYLCNIAQGAKEMQITLEQIPDSFIEVVSEVDKAFATIIPRHYAIDIMFEKDRPWVVELNNTPGMPDIAVQPLTDNYFNALIDLWLGKEIKGIKLKI